MSARRRFSLGLLALALALAPALALGACAAAIPRFPRRPIVWVDHDREPFAPAPEERYVPYYWDAMDHLVFRPAAEAWTLELARESIDVNALDEVPDSSFFTNRIGRAPMSPEEVARGACEEGFADPPGPWRIVGGKPSGASPGFVIEAADGTRYLLKTDRRGQPEQSTAADAIGAAVFHAAGYFVPCNRVVLFDPSILVLEPGARTSRALGRRRIRERDLERVVEAATPAPGGLRRALLSRYAEGQPLGPWDYVGTWDADPNDVVPHERRRELRGSYVLDAWLDHWDARQENTLAAWIETGGGGYVLHYLVDFGDALGMMRGSERVRARAGHATWLDVGQVVEDSLALGIARRPWDDRRPEPVLGYFDSEHFDADGWRPQYWNGAIDRRTERDCAWMARILARFEDDHVRALVGAGRYGDARIASRMEEVLIARRDRLLARYLTRVSPLADVAVESEGGATRVCATDLAVRTGVRAPEGRAVAARAYALEASGARAVGRVDVRERGDRVCARIPGGEAGEYLILDLVVRSEDDSTGPLRVHLARDPASGALALVGLQRPDRADPP